MTIIAILLALLFEKYPNIEKFKHYHWLNSYAEAVLRVLPVSKENAPWWNFVAVLLPLVAGIFIIQWVLDILWFGFGGFIFNIVVLVYCLGSSRISQYFIDMFSTNSSQEPVTIDAEYCETVSEGDVDSFIVKVHQQMFAVIFWFIIFGALGALLYRTLVMFKQYSDVPESKLKAYQKYIDFCLSVLDWPSVRLLSLCLSLGGAFMQAFPIWWQNILSGLTNNEKFLTDCTTAAADHTSDKLAVEHLFYRSVLILLVILALMTLASWIS